MNLDGVRVLIVEDDLDSCQLMAFILERLCGARVWTATTSTGPDGRWTRAAR